MLQFHIKYHCTYISPLGIDFLDNVDAIFGFVGAGTDKLPLNIFL